MLNVANTKLTSNLQRFHDSIESKNYETNNLWEEFITNLFQISSSSEAIKSRCPCDSFPKRSSEIHDLDFEKQNVGNALLSQS